MDFISHALSGAIVASLVCETPEQKAVVIIASVIPDLPFSPFYLALSKKLGKPVKEFTEEEFVEHAETIKPWRPIYLWMHSVLLLIIVSIAEYLCFKTYFFSIGMSLHIFYDLFTHKYDNEKLNPRPLYPFTDKPFNYGFTNGWKMGFKGMAISWLIHGLVLWMIIAR